MRNKKPPFEIQNVMIDYVAEIAELIGKLTSINLLSANPTLRRTNRIRTIHGSLAIEQNTLTLEQVTAVLIRWIQIEKFSETHPFIMNADVRALCDVSAATANRILAGITAAGKLVKCRERGHWAYVLSHEQPFETSEFK